MNDKFYEPFEFSEYKYSMVNIIQPIVVQNNLWEIANREKLKIYWSLQTRKINIKILLLNIKRELIKHA